MINVPSNLRKAAILIRSLDPATAAKLLGQLSADEAAVIRRASQGLGPIDAEEQADVLAQFRRTRPTTLESASQGVELSLSTAPTANSNTSADNRFDFLEHTAVDALAGFLAREHVQTICVVLAQLAPARAAAVLASLPNKLQAETVERMSSLGDVDPECIKVVEHELSAWLAKRAGTASFPGRGADRLSAILAATDGKTRDAILGNLKTHKARLADQLERETVPDNHRARRAPAPHRVAGSPVPPPRNKSTTLTRPRPDRRPAPAEPARQLSFDDLVRLDNRALAAVLHRVNSNVLALALAGSHDDLIERICEQMPKRTARLFRRELRRLGPTRLSDVEAAQRMVAQIAAEELAARRRPQRAMQLS